MVSTFIYQNVELFLEKGEVSIQDTFFFPVEVELNFTLKALFYRYYGDNILNLDDACMLPN